MAAAAIASKAGVMSNASSNPEKNLAPSTYKTKWLYMYLKHLDLPL